jgi:hypothetical protein
LPDDIHLVEHGHKWIYYFHDPYGAMVVGGGCRTQKKAHHMAERHRKAIGERLEEVCGL